MDHPPPHSALRQMRQHVMTARTLAVLVLVGIVATIAAPFGTGDAMSVLPRAAFWIGIVVLTYGLGSLVDAVLRPWLEGLRPAARVAIIAAATGAVIGAALQVITAAIFGLQDLQQELVSGMRNFIIGACVSVGVQIAHPANARFRDTMPEPRAPALLDRLPLDKRGALVAISVEDHYVRVRTTKGEEMLLMRLSDAIRETEPVEGLQVHRSHWVAGAAVQAARRAGDRAVLTMSAGDEIPASRTYVPALRAAGFLPK